MDALVRARIGTFTLGEIVYVLGQEPGAPGVGGSVVTHEQIHIGGSRVHVVLPPATDPPVRGDRMVVHPERSCDPAPRR